jgi:hypothetical protein
MGPRDTPEGMPYPVNPIDGRPISDAQKRRIAKLREASFLVRAVLYCVMVSLPRSGVAYASLRLSRRHG